MGGSTVILVFVCAVAAVYLFAACAVVRVLLRRFGFMEPPARAGLVAVRGNWDTAYWRRLELFEGTGVVELRKEAARVDVAGTTLWVAGAPFASLDDPPDGERSGIENTLKGVPPEAFTLSKFGKRYESGLHREGGRGSTSRAASAWRAAPPRASASSRAPR